jgi:hypothetical protein
MRQWIRAGLILEDPPTGRDGEGLPAPHWRRWRHGGTALSAALHVLVLAGLALSLPRSSPAQREAERALPVEIVERTPDAAKDAEREKEQKKEQEQAAERENEREKEKPAEPASKPPEPPPAAPAPHPVPPAQSSPAPNPIEPERRATSPQMPARPLAPPPEIALLEMRPPSAVPSLPPEPRPIPSGGQKLAVDDDAVPPPDAKGVGRWVLEPLTVNYGHRCGAAHLTAVIELTERVAEGRYRGTMRTRIGWDRCPPEGVLYHVEMRIAGDVVTLIGAEGFTDRGVIRGGLMLLQDAYGRSVWKKR